MQVKGISLDEYLRSNCSNSHGAALSAVLDGSDSCGLEASNFGAARRIVQTFLRQKRQNEPCRLLVSYTSNLVSCGVRETLVYLAKHNLVDGFVATAGGVEEDVIKCLGHTLIGDFALRGAELRKQGMNRIGNLLVPNDNYCAFENFFVPVLESLHAKQRGCRWTSFTTPSEIIAAVGEAMEPLPLKEESVVYWCYRHKIPLFCPALTDGSMGDMIYFYNFSRKGFVVDPIPDVMRINEVVECTEGGTGVICLGGGLPKHHLLRALGIAPVVSPRSVVMITTGLYVDGCASSCSVEDDASHAYTHTADAVVRVHGDASLLFPLML